MKYLFKNIIGINFFSLLREIFTRYFFFKKKVKIGKGINIKPGFSEIGKYTFIGPNVTIGPAVESIGSFCSIAQNVVIGPNTHEINKISSSTFIQAYEDSNKFSSQKRKSNYKVYKKNINNKPTIIGHDVWIGTGVTILPGVEIGTGSVIGANAVVTKNVDAYSIVVGNPAKFLRYRFSPEIINSLQALKIFEKNSDKVFNIFCKYSEINLEENISDLLKDFKNI